MSNEFELYEDHLEKFQKAIASNSYEHAVYMYGVPVEPEGYQAYKKANVKSVAQEGKPLEEKGKVFGEYEVHLAMFEDALASNGYAHAVYMYGLPVKPEGYDEYKKGL